MNALEEPAVGPPREAEGKTMEVHPLALLMQMGQPLPQCIGAVIAQTWNKKPGKKIPAWWREAE